MAPPVWILVLLVGPAWAEDQGPDPAWRQKLLDWKPPAESSRDRFILTQCDFEDDSRPLCDWSQESEDDGEWVRTSGPSPIGTAGPPGGYPNGEGHYLRMDSSTFHWGGVARLRSPNLWEQGPLCVRFAYHMFGLSWGAQLRLLLLRGAPGGRPRVLWKHVNAQSPSWMPTTVTVPAELILPSWLIFEGIRGNTAYLDISLDTLSIRRGTCNQVCLMQMCSFDTLNDLCGWSWIPTATGAKWTQKKGSSGQPDVGPNDDFSSPGSGFYMLLDPTHAKPRQKSVLLSPLSPSTGCLTLSFYYILWGTSPGAALLVYASVLGSIRKHTLFSAQPAQTWQPVSVNYTGEGQIQFTLVGVFGKIPEPAVAVDSISIAPCEDRFPQCNFEDSSHPFCDWTQMSEDGGHWSWGSKNGLDPASAPSEDASFAGQHYIYLEGDKFSRAGQSVRLASRPFCAPGYICVQFAYHVYGLGEGARLQFLLGSPAGSLPVPLWNCVGSQGPDWLTSSVTIPAGYPQPMQLVFEATLGSNSAFVVALGFIRINHGMCRVPTPSVLPTGPLVPPTRPSEIIVPTEKPTVPTEATTVLTESSTACNPPCSNLTVLPTEPRTLGTSAHTPSTSVTTTTPRPASVSCPLHAHPEPCACPASCESPKPSCGMPCQPGCVCKPGFLFQNDQCIEASSCDCFYSNNYYKPGETWFSPNCTELCRCWPGRRIECQISQCGTRTVCQLEEGQYGCRPYGAASCVVYGDLHYITFDERHIGFTGRCTYVLTQPCDNSTDPFFRVTAKNEERGPTGVSCLSKIYITLPTLNITLLKGKHTLIGGQRVTLPAMPSKDVFVSLSGRFVELKTVFGLRVRWDGDQQLFVTLPSAFSGQLCGLCGNYDGDSSNDMLKADSSLAQDDAELGNSWQTAEEENRECQQSQGKPPSCDSALASIVSGPGFCGQLVDSHGAFETCLLHVNASSFFSNCVSDMCSFQGLPLVVCTHMAALTAICQDAGYAVKPWRGPQFCPLACPSNSKYSLCAKPCPETCHSGFSAPMCPDECVETCECDPGFVLSGLECVPKSKCGCLSSSRTYLKTGERWYKPGCKELCICDGNNAVRCWRSKCRTQEACGQKNGIYGCHAQGSATCTASGDPHYLTFDGALHHFMGTCTYVLTRPCWSEEYNFIVSATNENRDGNLEVSYVKAVHIQVFDLKITLLKGRKTMVNGQRVTLPLGPLRGQVLLMLSGSFILLYTRFGLQVRYDGNHLVEVTVPSSYAGRLCGLCGNYNNNSLDDNLRPDRKPESGSLQLGASWKVAEDSESGCFLEGGKPSSCQESNMADTWDKSCEILTNPLGPFSDCHQVVPPQASFSSCVFGQCATNGDALTLCRSLQAYASLCALAGLALVWRNSTFCAPRCPPGSRYTPCANPCPASCGTLSSPGDYLGSLPCVEGCECQEGYILSGTSCVPPSQCGCVDQWGSYHLLGESWYTDKTCTTKCTCLVHNNITCGSTACTADQLCWALDGLLRCRSPDIMGVCRMSEDFQYMSFDGPGHPLQDACTHVLVKVCHPTMDLPYFKISAKSESSEDRTGAFYLSQVYVDIFSSRVVLQRGHQVLINGTMVTLPATSQIPGVRITSRTIYTVFTFRAGVQIVFDGSQFLEITVPVAYYQKLCGVCGNFDGEAEEELMMPSNELAQDDQEFMNSWKDTDIDPDCQKVNDSIQVEEQEIESGKCKPGEFERARESCQAAIQNPGWARCAALVPLKPFLVRCIISTCELGGLSLALCDSLKAFETACQSQGLKPPLWRTSKFCPLECPAHHVYTNCLPQCTPSCWDVNGCEGNNTQNPSVCLDGCTCQSGYVLKEKECVPRSQCPCKDTQGGFIPANKTWISTGCTQRCACTEGTIQCLPFRCPGASYCQQSIDGSSNCAANKTDQCIIFGDPYYRTFDHVSYRFQGRMTYVLIQTVDELPDGVEPLVVEGRNKMGLRSPILQEVIVSVYGYKVQLQEDLGLAVNNEKVAIPYSLSDHVQIIMRAQQLCLVTDFEMVISFDGKQNAVIILPSMYQGLVRGLCGNYDVDRENDLMLPNGQLTTDPIVFGNSWEVKPQGTVRRFRRSLQEEEEGEKGDSAFLGTECSPERLAFINGTQACRVLVDPQGPFAACHHIVAPELFQEFCMLDLCTAQDPKEVEELRCRVLSGYAILCQEAGATLAGWRNYTRCAMVCPANTVYQSCMTPCPASCANLVPPRHCEGPCLEGCASLPGYIYSGTQSLPVASCGCTAGGVYYQLGAGFITEDCSQHCTCASPGALLCESFGCRAGETCTLANLTRGCFQESPCLQNPCHNDGRCHEQGDSFICECELGYGGALCTEPRAIPWRKGAGASNFVAILLGVMVPVLVILPAMTKECVYRRRRRSRGRRKMRS